jgi:hypothetical protein
MPDIWLVGNIKPIYKNKGNPLDPKNFRPINSCLGKLCTAILNERLCRFSEEVLDERNPIWFPKILLDDEQFFHIIFVFEIVKRKKKCFVPLSTSKKLLTRYGEMHYGTNYY